MTGTDLAVWRTRGTGKSLGFFVDVFVYLGLVGFFVCLFCLWDLFWVFLCFLFVCFLNIILFESYAANSKEKTGKIF